MRKSLVCLFALGLLLAGSVVAEDSSTFKLYWKEGVRMDTADKAFQLKAGGRAMIDFNIQLGQDGDYKDVSGDPFDSGTEVRRARLYWEGTIYSRVDFKVQFDFTGESVVLKDVWVGVNKLPAVGHVKVGHMKEPFMLEELTSSKYITMIERSPLNGAFGLGRNTGIMLHNSHLDGDRLTWAIGIFTDTDDGGTSVSENNFALTLRITGLPYYDDGGKRLLHVGIGVTFRILDTGDSGHTVRYRARPSTHFTGRLVDTSSINADSDIRFGAEVAFVWYGFSAQAEVIISTMNLDEDRSGIDKSTLTFWGFYIELSYFVTGENRAYKNKSGTFSRVKPKNRLFDGGWGAFQIVVRFTYLDLEEEPVYGGEMMDIVIGVNWHWNPNTRIMLNGVYCNVRSPESDFEGQVMYVVIRFQVDF